eukprot:TRINITY_DN11889_c0_g1_i1.p1 TRINITY_DN11889_c0_g1~~TRINITY_DN11889_c0_g1_i1.p1  ORF type:complete len:1443 (+),score=293.66 TRINITY_DN11889_c0_g1_i1:61-4389(+)
MRRELPVYRFDARPPVAASNAGGCALRASQYHDCGVEPAQLVDGTPCLLCWRVTTGSHTAGQAAQAGSVLHLWAVCTDELTKSAPLPLLKPVRSIELNGVIAPTPRLVRVSAEQRLLVCTSSGRVLSFLVSIMHEQAPGTVGRAHALSVDVGQPPYAAAEVVELPRVRSIELVQGDDGGVLAVAAVSSWDRPETDAAALRIMEIRHMQDEAGMTVVEAVDRGHVTQGWTALHARLRITAFTTLRCADAVAVLALDSRGSLSMHSARTDGGRITRRFEFNAAAAVDVAPGNIITECVCSSNAVGSGDADMPLLLALVESSAAAAQTVHLLRVVTDSHGLSSQPESLAKLRSPLPGAVTATMRFSSTHLHVLWQAASDDSGDTDDPFIYLPLGPSDVTCRQALSSVATQGATWADGWDSAPAHELVDVRSAVRNEVVPSGLVSGTLGSVPVLWLVRECGMSILTAAAPLEAVLTGSSPVALADDRPAARLPFTSYPRPLVGVTGHVAVPPPAPVEPALKSLADVVRLGGGAVCALMVNATSLVRDVIELQPGDVAGMLPHWVSAAAAHVCTPLDAAVCEEVAAMVDACAAHELRVRSDAPSIPPVAAQAAAQQGAYRVLALRLAACVLHAAHGDTTDAGRGFAAVVESAHVYAVLCDEDADMELLVDASVRAQPGDGAALEGGRLLRAALTAVRNLGARPHGEPRTDAADALRTLLGLRRFGAAMDTAEVRERYCNLLSCWLFSDADSHCQTALSEHADAFAAAVRTHPDDHSIAAGRFHAAADCFETMTVDEARGPLQVLAGCVPTDDHRRSLFGDWVCSNVASGAVPRTLYLYVSARLLQAFSADLAMESLGSCAAEVLPASGAITAALPVWTPQEWAHLHELHTSRVHRLIAVARSAMSRRGIRTTLGWEHVRHAALDTPDALCFERRVAPQLVDALSEPHPVAQWLLEADWGPAAEAPCRIRLQVTAAPTQDHFVARVQLPPADVCSSGYQSMRQVGAPLWISVLGGSGLVGLSLADGSARTQRCTAAAVGVPTEDGVDTYTVPLVLCLQAGSAAQSSAGAELLLVASFAHTTPGMLRCRPIGTARGASCGAEAVEGPASHLRVLAAALWERGEGLTDSELAQGAAAAPQYFTLLATLAANSGLHRCASRAHYRVFERLRQVPRSDVAHLRAAVRSLRLVAAHLQESGCGSFNTCDDSPCGASGGEVVTAADVRRALCCAEAELELCAGDSSAAAELPSRTVSEKVAMLCAADGFMTASRLADCFDLSDGLETVFRAFAARVTGLRASEDARARAWAPAQQLLRRYCGSDVAWRYHLAVADECLKRRADPPRAVLDELRRVRPDAVVATWLRYGSGCEDKELQTSSLTAAADVTLQWLRWVGEGRPEGTFDQHAAFGADLVTRVLQACRRAAAGDAAVGVRAQELQRAWDTGRGGFAASA